MAFGTPVIGSDTAGIAEQIVNGESGYLFTPGDEHVLTAAIDRLFADEQLRREMGRKGRDRSLTCFDIEQSYRAPMTVFEVTRRARGALQSNPDGAIAQ